MFEFRKVWVDSNSACSMICRRGTELDFFHPALSEYEQMQGNDRFVLDMKRRMPMSEPMYNRLPTGLSFRFPSIHLQSRMGPP